MQLLFLIYYPQFRLCDLVSVSSEHFFRIDTLIKRAETY